MKLHVGLILLHVAVCFVHGGSADEALDQLSVLPGGSRHRLSEHRKKQTQLMIDFSTEDFQGGGTEDHSSALPRNLGHKHKKKNKKYKDEPDDDYKKDESNNAKKMKNDGKKKKNMKEAVAKAVDKKKVDGDWSSEKDCNCDDWTGDSWSSESLSADSWSGSADSWSEDSWTADHGLPIGWNEDGWDDNEYYTDVLEDLRADIIRLIHDTERDLIPKCLRLAFHDCIGGCDGCIDPDVLDNRGLEEPIETLFPLVQKYQDKLSRADVWAYCAIISADMAVVDNRPHDLYFYMNYVGRKDCKGADEKGFGGPEVLMYEPYLTTHEMIEFFYDRFGFSPYEMVVLMGVHSSAVAHRENVGFGNVGKEDGWVDEANEYKLSNLYYKSMLSSGWEIEKVENEGIVPSRHQWYFDEEGVGPIMLTSDMSLILNFEGYIVTDSKGVEGKVMCLAHPDAEFELREEGDPDHLPLCPMAKQTREYVEELVNDNEQFLFAFVVVLNKMVANGYYGHDLALGKSGKKSKGKKSNGKSGKGKGHNRNLISSKDDGEDAETEDYLPLEAVKSTTTVQLQHRSSGAMKKRCSCH
mmetsp:Transcript_11944/g.19585  ORF Transcript_11944/g.19585 Transcript_11944/m.19585 type:complete len:581 (-) Transcript_11944:52-1794(-)